MRTIAIGILGIVLVHGVATAQTPGEQAIVIRDFYWNIADYNTHRLCDPAHHATAASPAPRIFTLPVAMVFRQIITKALDEANPATAMGAAGHWTAHHPVVLEPFPASELYDFPEGLARALPGLPDFLEYRLIGRDLVLRDVGADVIVGVLRDAIGGISTVRR
jgi:hypothetical protein